MDKPKSTRGGARAGAGRKPKPAEQKRKQYSFWATPEEAKKVREVLKQILKPRLKKKDA